MHAVSLIQLQEENLLLLGAATDPPGRVRFSGINSSRGLISGNDITAFVPVENHF
jgi:hypothetical protein